LLVFPELFCKSDSGMERGFEKDDHGVLADSRLLVGVITVMA
jgi:hypothetical protein